MILSQNSDKKSDELSEDIEVIGPGQILSEARKKLSLSTEDVAKKLNFKISLVDNIEQDIFDQTLPSTYNRGYLRSYAQLVKVDINDVLSAYDMLGVAELQRSEMQSFSNLTEKQAEHSRLMWFSYFIVAILCGLLIMWWWQEPKQSVEDNSVAEKVASSLPILSTDTQKLTQVAPTIDSPQSIENHNETINTESSQQSTTESITAADIDSLNHENSISTESMAEDESNAPEVQPDDGAVSAEISTAVFTFSGDCWVNIYDATGERIAWGVKKSGYVMTISGEAPLKVTLGRPELATIVFNDESVDLSSFSEGNVAKFTLPMTL